MKTRTLVYIALIAALYIVFTVSLAPISYGLIQFRISEMLKVFVLFDPLLALGIGIGTFFANMSSPTVGFWELVWMPITDILGGFLAYFIYKLVLRKTKILSMLVYAVTTGFSVGIMLSFFGIGIWYIISIPIIISETIILIIGIPIISYIAKYSIDKEKEETVV